MIQKATEIFCIHNVLYALAKRISQHFPLPTKTMPQTKFPIHEAPAQTQKHQHPNDEICLARSYRVPLAHLFLPSDPVFRSSRVVRHSQYPEGRISRYESDVVWKRS